MFLNDFEQNAKAKSANCKELTRDIYGPRQMSDRARTVNIGKKRSKNSKEDHTIWLHTILSVHYT